MKRDYPCLANPPQLGSLECCLCCFSSSVVLRHKALRPPPPASAASSTVAALEPSNASASGGIGVAHVLYVEISTAPLTDTQVTATATITNRSNSEVTDITYSLTLPPELQLISSDLPQSDTIAPLAVKSYSFVVQGAVPLPTRLDLDVSAMINGETTGSAGIIFLAQRNGQLTLIEQGEALIILDDIEMAKQPQGEYEGRIAKDNSLDVDLDPIRDGYIDLQVAKADTFVWSPENLPQEETSTDQSKPNAVIDPDPPTPLCVPSKPNVVPQEPVEQEPVAGTQPETVIFLPITAIGVPASVASAASSASSPTAIAMTVSGSFGFCDHQVTSTSNGVPAVSRNKSIRKAKVTVEGYSSQKITNDGFSTVGEGYTDNSGKFTIKITSFSYSKVRVKVCTVGPDKYKGVQVVAPVTGSGIGKPFCMVSWEKTPAATVNFNTVVAADTRAAGAPWNIYGTALDSWEYFGANTSRTPVGLVINWQIGYSLGTGASAFLVDRVQLDGTLENGD